MKSVILYFGSFNPIHNGHMAVAEYVIGKDLCDELWFVVSPQNPLKERDTLIPERERFEMVELAVGASAYASRMKAVDVEFSLPKPSYTIDTLRTLKSLHPGICFSILMGADAASGIERWKEWKTITENYSIYVYPRRGYGNKTGGRFVILEDAPYFDYSSTEIREAIAAGGDPSGMLAPQVAKYIKCNKLWI